MQTRESTGVTTLLGQLQTSGGGPFSEVIELVYGDLHALVEGRMKRRFNPRGAGLTLQPTAIVNDLLMELRDQRNSFENAEHFFAIAARLTERLLAHYQESRRAKKRQWNWQNTATADDERRGGSEPEDQAQIAGQNLDVEAAAAIASAMKTLHEVNPRRAEVLTLHLLGGMPMPRVAQCIGVSLPTVERDWRFARAWLADELREYDPSSN